MLDDWKRTKAGHYVSGDIVVTRDWDQLIGDCWYVTAPKGTATYGDWKNYRAYYGMDKPPWVKTLVEAQKLIVDFHKQREQLRERMDEWVEPDLSGWPKKRKP